MSTRLALDLDHDAIRLLSHQSDGWVVEGSAALDSPDLSDRISALHQRAVDLIGEDPSVLLVLPRSQILYATVESSDNPDAQIAGFLEGATPYAVADLTWDHASSGDVTHIAAVPLETLDEAMAFAASSRFRVTGLTSEPPEGEFPRMPVFQRLPGFLRTAPDARPIVLEPATPPKRSAVAFSSQREADYAPKRRALSLAAAEKARQAALKVPKKASGAVTALKAPVVAASKATLDLGTAAVSGAGAAGRSATNAVVAVPRPILGAGAAVAAALLAFALWPEGDPDPLAARNADLSFAVLPADLDQGMAAPEAAEAPLLPGATDPVTILRDAPAITVPIVLGQSAVRADYTAGAAPEYAFEMVARLPAHFGETRLPDARPAPPSRSSSPPFPEPENAPIAAAPARVGTPSPTETPQVPESAPPQIAAVTANELNRTASLLPDAGLPSLLPQTEPLPDDPVLLADGPAPSATPLETPAYQDLVARVSVEPPERVEARLPTAQALRANAPDAAMALLPPAASTEFALGEDGFVDATPEGTLTPSGVLAIAGAPALVAPPRPGTEEEAAAAALSAAEPDDNRDPSDVAGEPALDVTETVLVSRGNPNPELGSVPPRPRPSTALAEAVDVPEIPEEVIADALALPDEETAEETEPVMTASLMPRPRPARPAAAPAPQPPSTTQAAATRAVQSTPQIPTRSNVAREATVEDALPLGQLNLIGVYGGPTDRRALVRLPTGRFVKLKVGDRLDGGRVAQIGSDRLVYQKGQRALALEMPNT